MAMIGAFHSRDPFCIGEDGLGLSVSGNAVYGLLRIRKKTYAAIGSSRFITCKPGLGCWLDDGLSSSSSTTY